MNNKSVSNKDLMSIITYLLEGWGRNEIAFKVGCNSDVVSRINNGKYLVPQQVIDSLPNYQQGLVIQDNVSKDKKALLRSREAGPIIAKANVVSEQLEKEQYIFFRSVTDLISSGLVPLSFKDNLNNAAKGRKGGDSGHYYSNVEWFLLKDIAKGNIQGVPSSLIEIIKNKDFKNIIYKPTINNYSQESYFKISNGNILIHDLIDALVMSEEYLSLLIDFYQFAKVDEGRIKSINHPYKKRIKRSKSNMYYVVYIGYEPDASLYERNVISFHQACETFESIEEAREYIKEYIIDNLKLDASAGEVDADEIEVDYKEDKDRVRLDAYYGDTCIYVYECWIMESL